MLLLKDAGAMFVRIPKCGTIYVQRALDAVGITVQRAARIAHPHYDFGLEHAPPWAMAWPTKPLAFAFVRHPVTWYESWWKYQQWQDWPKMGTDAVPRTSHPQTMLEGLGSDSFDVFVRNVISREPAYVTRLYEWFLGPENAPHIDPAFVGRLESIHVDLGRFLRSFGYASAALQIPEEPEHVSPTESPVWERETFWRVVELEQAAIRRFGYDGPAPVQVKA